MAPLEGNVGRISRTLHLNFRTDICYATAKIRRTGPDPAHPLTPPTPAKPSSKATDALAEVSPELALRTLERLIQGYQDKSGSGYAAATTNLAGCVLVQKGANRLVSCLPTLQALGASPGADSG